MSSRNRITRTARAALALLAAAAAFGCADGSNLPPPSFATNTGPGLERAYRLEIGDKVKLAVFNEDNLSGEFEVSGTGNIPVPLIGDVRARGRTLQQIRETIRRELANGYVRNPRVTLEVTNYRPFFVHGEVKTGGQFDYRANLSFNDAIAMAGGFTYRAEKGYLVLSRNGGTPVRLDLPSSIVVLPGDNIRVTERFF